MRRSPPPRDPTSEPPLGLSFDTEFVAGREFVWSDRFERDTPITVRESPAAEAMREMARVLDAGGTITRVGVDRFGAASYACLVTIRQALATGNWSDAEIAALAGAYVEAAAIRDDHPTLAPIWHTEDGRATMPRIYGPQVEALRRQFDAEARAEVTAARRDRASAYGLAPEMIGPFIRRNPGPRR